MRPVSLDITETIAAMRPGRLETVVWVGILTLETAIILAYVVLANAQLGLFHVYPFVWLNLSGWVLWRTSPPGASVRTKRIAGSIAGGYVIGLAFIAGLIGPGHAFHGHDGIPTEQLATGLAIHTSLPPGYGPALTYSGEYVVATLTPYLVVGFLALTALVYVILLEAGRSVAYCGLGVFTCVGCSVPLLATLVTGSAAMPLLAAAYSHAYALSTVAFVVTVLLLYWRPFESRFRS